jgi:protein gp37
MTTSRLTVGVSFFFKQWGGINKKRTGRLLEGRTWDDLPKNSIAA